MGVRQESDRVHSTTNGKVVFKKKYSVQTTWFGLLGLILCAVFLVAMAALSGLVVHAMVDFFRAGWEAWG